MNQIYTHPKRKTKVVFVQLGSPTEPPTKALRKYLRKIFGDKYPTPKFVAPKFIVWLFSPLLGVKRTFIRKNVGYDFYFDNQKSKDELGMEYTDVDKSASEFFQQFIDHNLI